MAEADDYPANNQRPQSWLVPKHRRVIVDLMHFQKELPMVAQERTVCLKRLTQVRACFPVRISLAVIFLKAFALVARGLPQLRQTYMPGLFPRIYQHPFSIGTLAISRNVDGIEQLFFARFVAPETQTLLELQSRLHHFQTESVDVVFGDHLRIQKYPWPLRRMAWALRLYGSGNKRIKRLGTFGLTTLAGRQTTIQKPISPVPFLVTYGPLNRNTELTLTICYDHRLVDGAFIAKVLAEIEETLAGPLANELTLVRLAA